MVRTSTTTLTSCGLNKSTNSPTVRVECPIVKNRCVMFQTHGWTTALNYHEPPLQRAFPLELFDRARSRALQERRGFALYLAPSNRSTGPVQDRSAHFPL